jgi:hypothetical protein
MAARREIQVARALAEGEQVGWLHLSHLWMTKITAATFSISNLLRLDVGHNDLRELPAELAQLSHLREIWANNNPLRRIAPELHKCEKLELLDLRETLLEDLPKELGRLQNLEVIRLEHTRHLRAELQEAYTRSAGDLLELLRAHDCTQQLRSQLEDKFRMGPYRVLWLEPDGPRRISALAGAVIETFTENEDIKNVIRNCDRLFPPNISSVNVPEIKRKFALLKEQNQRKKLAANLELRLRALYFDRINPEHVEPMVKSIYSEIQELKDIRFIIKYARKVFPADSHQVSAVHVREAMEDLKTVMAAERAEAVKNVQNALDVMYSHVNPKELKELCVAVCESFSKVEDLKKLATDAGLYFPSEFEPAMEDPRGIYLDFVEQNKQISNDK